MKRIVILLLCSVSLFCLACTGDAPQTGEPDHPIVIETENTPEIIEQQTAQPTDAVAGQTEKPAEATPAGETVQVEPTGVPTPVETPVPAFKTQVYDVYHEVGTSVSEAEMFRSDIDFDGKEEVISFRLDEENNTTTILINDMEVLFDTSSQLTEVVLIDLDPETPWINLLVEIDWASDDYVTTEVHLENGQPVKGVQTGGIGITEDGAVIVYGDSDFLGTKTFGAVATGESLTVEAEWFDCHHPSEEEIRDEFEVLVEWGDLLHTTREVPCTINGKPAKIAKDSYIYPVRINPVEGLCEVCTLDGITAVIAFTLDEDGWPYLIDGIPQDDYFEYILYAD
ncbi:MAG: hypothetical protein IKP38_02955 [Clostridia bacterium]|nr:hypothetical protein [Clostridia bacterium]